MSRKIIVILGPTASGKSALAVKMAKKINGEIISADSRQVYKGLDIGSGKITKKEMSGIPHYCMDIISPKKIFTVVDFKKCAEKAIEKIFAKNPRRLIRAIEIAKKLGKTPKLMSMSRRDLDIRQIGIKLPDEILKKNIEKRIKKMLKNGLVAETKKLKSSVLPWKRIYELGFEYK